MRIYIEAIEITEGLEPDFIRLEIDDMMNEEEAIRMIEELMIPPYMIQRHICRHDSDPPQPCTAETIRIVR